MGACVVPDSYIFKNGRGLFFFRMFTDLEKCLCSPCG